MKELIVKLTDDVCSIQKELLRLWKDYVKQHGDIDLKGTYITMWDGGGERMQKLVCRKDELTLIDVYGNPWSMDSDVGVDTLVELHDVVLVGGTSSEE